MDSNLRNPEPDLKIEKLSIWIDGRQFPNADDYDDGNWLNVRSEYRSANSTIKASGPILMTRDIDRFMKECQKMNESISGEASLHSYEINLDVKLKMEKRGQIDAEINLTHDHITEEHKFMVRIDQSYLNEIVQQCEMILNRFPIRGTY